MPFPELETRPSTANFIGGARMVSIKDIRDDWRLLDEQIALPKNIRLLSHEEFAASGVAKVETVSPGAFSSFFYFLSQELKMMSSSP